MQNKNLVTNHLQHIIFGILITLTVGVAILLRGSDALTGILWQETEATDYTVTAPIDRSTLTVNVGVYDYVGSFADIENLAFVHNFIDWNKFDSQEYSVWTDTLKQKGSWPLLTVEPFSQTTDQDNSLLGDVESGIYDEQIDAVCASIEESGQSTFVRWGHEMERVTGRYPWAVNDAEEYIAAYRHFVDRCRQSLVSTDVFFVWSPVGNKELHQYWPGREYVDYVGLSVYAFNEWELANYDHVRSFEEIFIEKYERVAQYDRPILIAELGVNGTPEFQAYWFNEMLSVVDKYPLLKTIVYFNAPDSPKAWGSDYSTPNWEIDPDLFAN